jgi:hypothetical protein
MIIVGTSCAMYLQVNVSVNRTGCLPLSLCTSSCVNMTEEKIVEKIVYRNSTVDVPGPERIVEVPGPERFVYIYRDKVVEKSILVEKNLTEGTVCTCKPGYYYSAAGTRFER